MELKITYFEATKLLNRFVADPGESDNMKYHFSPIQDGIKIKFEKLKWKIFNFKKSVQAEVRRFEHGELEVKVAINSFLLDLLKKLFMEMVYKFLKHKMQDEDVDFTDYIQVSKSKIYIQVNSLLNLMDVPVYVEELNSNEDHLQVKVKIV